MGKEIVGMGRQGVVQDAFHPQEWLDASRLVRQKSVSPMQEISTTSDDLEKKQHRRLWLVMGGITLLVLGVLFALIVWYDGPAPDDSAMTPPPFAKGDTANPLSMFCIEMEKVSFGRLPEFSGERRYPGMVACSNRERLAKPANDPESVTRRENAEAYLEELAAVLDSFDKLLQTDIATWKWQEQTSMRTRQTSKYVQSIRNLRSVLHLKADVLAQQGRMEEAATLALQMCRLGKGMCNAKGGSEQFVLGIALTDAGQLALEHALTFSEPSPELLRRCITELAAVEAPQCDEFLLTVKTDYQYFKHHVLRKDFASAAGRLGKLDAAEKLMETLLFKPNQSLAELLACETPVIAALDKGWHAAIVEASSQDTEWKSEVAKRGVLMYVHPNFAGRAVARIAAHGSHYKLEKALNSLMRNRQIRVVLAMRLHDLEKGTLPAQLQDLVPAYLPDVPKDEYSDKPMLWNAAKGKVYSVGEDMKDDGGNGEPEYRRASDIVTIYWWMESSKSARSR